MSYTHNTAPTERVTAANGIEFAFRRFGTPSGTPLVFINHYRGNLDTFDPAVTDELAKGRQVILFDNAGVAGSSGEPKNSLEGMAADAEAFLDALGHGQYDLIGFSMGGQVAQQIVVDRPELVRKLVLAGTGPRAGEGMKQMTASTLALFLRTDWEPADELWGPVFFSDSDKGKAAARDYLTRTRERTDRDAPVSAAVAQAHGEAAAGWGAPGQSQEYLTKITQPTLIVNGSNDIVIPTINSYLMFQAIPNARLVLYPDGNHGAHYENNRHFARELQYFLDVE
ncbi:alpha/beta fold hydrolase [Gryllotalpicola protaetiae]|uniref:alpha/beta fold hydrolase n=1 Tax=Gryllotalpicola protaetiae TaxID=2419771 RepID=UPI001C65E8BF|nr:alpha/beta hydrolase [Gryllotalpicola protaetiae]